MKVTRAGEKTNKLLSEKSPYLLQHAHNPVDWYPWGPDAFEKARREDKPVFLSIGYSTCHWCHVMAHESFEDPEIARMMNTAFVSMKVDREERPDIDSLYMKACQVMTGSGGWPLTIVMTPEKMPFFAATYLPKESRPGLMGMRELITRIQEVWRSQRGSIEKSAKVLVENLRRTPSGAQRGGNLEREISRLLFCSSHDFMTIFMVALRIHPSSRPHTTCSSSFGIGGELEMSRRFRWWRRRFRKCVGEEYLTR